MPEQRLFNIRLFLLRHIIAFLCLATADNISARCLGAICNSKITIEKHKNVKGHVYGMRVETRRQSDSWPQLCIRHHMEMLNRPFPIHGWNLGEGLLEVQIWDLLTEIVVDSSSHEIVWDHQGECRQEREENRGLSPTAVHTTKLESRRRASRGDKKDESSGRKTKKMRDRGR